jgi:hypothetical protein
MPLSQVVSQLSSRKQLILQNVGQSLNILFETDKILFKIVLQGCCNKTYFEGEAAVQQKE